MLTIITTRQFEKGVKRMKKRDKNMSKLKKVISKLENGEPPDKRFKDHQLVGNWNEHRECHIEPDWLLVYKTTETYLYLTQTGSHSDLF